MEDKYTYTNRERIAFEQYIEENKSIYPYKEYTKEIIDNFFKVSALMEDAAHIHESTYHHTHPMYIRNKEHLPLTPLTNNEDDWEDWTNLHHTFCDDNTNYKYYVHKRYHPLCKIVYEDGTEHFIDSHRIVFINTVDGFITYAEELDSLVSTFEGVKPIKFPYYPDISNLMLRRTSSITVIGERYVLKHNKNAKCTYLLKLMTIRAVYKNEDCRDYREHITNDINKYYIVDKYTNTHKEIDESEFIELKKTAIAPDCSDKPVMVY